MIFSCTACKKKENLVELSQNLTTYNIELSLDAVNKTVQAKQTVDYINSTGQILKTLKFHLYPQFFKSGATDKVIPNTKLNQAYPNGMDYSEFEVTRISLSNQDQAIVYSNDFNSILSIELLNSILPDERVSIYMEYNFKLPNCQHRFGYGENTINLANFYPILCIYENGKFNENGYNQNGDPFYSDMANYCVLLTIDDKFEVAGTGEKSLVSSENGNKTYKFNAHMVRDFALVASDKFNIKSAKLDDILVEYYFVNDTDSDRSLQTAIDSIKTFSARFGNYPYNTFTVVETDFIYGGMEYPTLIMISNQIENQDDYLNVIVHETAHQWWYGMVGNDEFTYPWLDEALTEFSTILFYDNNSGYNFTHEQMVTACKDNFSLFVTVYEDVLGTIDTSMRPIDKYETEPEYTYCTYVKGVLMFESLYQLIGEKDFYKALEIYFSENKYKNAIPENLISAFEQASSQHLSNFFDSWIKGKVVIR